MVLIAAAVCTKAGKTIVSRQFVEMTKARIEGLLAAFPKLIPAGTQHTFVETDSVRYVYQPLERLYMLLITTRASNILEDLETLRLFARVLPEYSRSLEEAEIADNAFNLIFAFDEIVALGYRESVNLAQIRTFVEMDSHDEKVYQAVRQTQEREAKNMMREKAKELQRQRMEAAKKGISGGKSTSFGNSSGGFGNSAGYIPTPIVGDLANTNVDTTPKAPSYSSLPSKPSSRGGMKLGGKGRDVESFVDQLKSEGESMVPTTGGGKGGSDKVSAQTMDTGEGSGGGNHAGDEVRLRQEEKLTVRLGRDGGVQQFELSGLITLFIADDRFGKIRIQLDNMDQRQVQLQTHPNVDKDLFKTKSQIGLKVPNRPFPIRTDVGVLKWRLQASSGSAAIESLVPLMINCWPSPTNDGGCDVNIEYELAHTNLELADLTIQIPLPIGSTPVVGDCDGNYQHETRRNILVWSVPIVDEGNKTGAMEFTIPKAQPAQFFPLTVSFTSQSRYADIKITDVILTDDESPVKYSVETAVIPEKYEVL